MLEGLARSGFCGAEGRIRTADTVIFSHVLYRLSYLGAYLITQTKVGDRGLEPLTSSV